MMKKYRKLSFIIKSYHNDTYTYGTAQNIEKFCFNNDSYIRIRESHFYYVDYPCQSFFYNSTKQIRYIRIKTAI